MLSVKKVFKLLWLGLLVLRHKDPCPVTRHKEKVPKVSFQDELLAADKTYWFHAEVSQSSESFLCIPDSKATLYQMDGIVFFLKQIICRDYENN